jgi:predicted flavoprotein YhiN
MDFRTDVVIVGTGVAGTFSALNLPKDKNIIMITKSDLESSDSFLAQGGICVLTDENDYDNYFEDTPLLWKLRRKISNLIEPVLLIEDMSNPLYCDIARTGILI